MIEQRDAEKAVRYLRESAEELAAAKAELTRAELMLKSVKALAMKASGETSAAAQEREAYISFEWEQAVMEVMTATKAVETIKAKREAANALWDFYRTVAADERAASKVR